MTKFLRVRGARAGDPLHEFDVPTSRVERHPDRYEVINIEPVAAQRPVSYISGVRTPPAVRETKPGEDSTAPSEGPPQEEK